MSNNKAASRRMTRQRQAIINMLAASHEHPTAEMIYAAVCRELPDISLGTVYRNLQLLVAEGQVREIAKGREGARFDGNLQPHSHFFCQCCGAVYDVPAYPAEISPEYLHNMPGRLLNQRTDFFGICQECLAAEKVPEA